jgi:predicted RNase H-like nuclease (RuvC/YqgF family)
MDWTSIIIAVVGGGALVTLIDRLFGRRHAQAETIKLLQEISQSQLTMMQGQMDAMQNRLERLEADIEGRDMIIAELKKQIADLECRNEELERINVKLLKDNCTYGSEIKELREQISKLKAACQDDTES